MTLREPIKNAAIVMGIRLPIPTISLMYFLPVASKMAPAQKNRVIFPKACMAMCIMLPVTPFGVRRAIPRIM